MTTNQSYLTEVRDKIFGGPDRDMFLHVGYFLCWFAHVELNLTFLLARAINHRQLDDFELLVKGMDARVKCERLRKALKGKKTTWSQLFSTARSF
jgi:hypothetical protein